MADRSWSAVRAVARQLLRGYGWIFVGFWAVLITGTIVFRLALRMGINSPGSTAWQWFTVSPPKWFLFVLAIIAATVYLPSFIGHGITRRNAALGTGIVFGGAAVTFGLALVAGFAVERFLLAADGRLTAAHPAASFGSLATVALTAVLHYAAFSLAGWLVGVGFYRFGAWGGIAFVTPAMVPAAVTEAVFDGGKLGNDYNNVLRLGDLPLFAAAGASTVALAVGALAAYGIVRTLAIRKVSG
jgi:hypothetical protein